MSETTIFPLSDISDFLPNSNRCLSFKYTAKSIRSHTAQNLQGSLSCQKVTQVELGGSCWRILPEWYWFYDPGCLVPPPEASYWSQVLVWWHKPLMIIQQCQERRTRRRWTLCGSPNVQNGRDRRQLGLGSVVTLQVLLKTLTPLNDNYALKRTFTTSRDFALQPRKDWLAPDSPCWLPLVKGKTCLTCHVPI